METLTKPTQTSELQEQIDAQRMQIRTDSYSMSIGEWTSLYESKEVDIHPEFQRFFRWTPFQKSRLIESIMLGIPIPPVFVSQRADGVWDVVDGLQRLSTVYEFMGMLKDAQGNYKPNLKLEKPNLLTALEGKVWDEEAGSRDYLTSQQRLLIKRAKIDVNIILRESDSKTQYELFNRLNTGGTQLSDQEVRNSILVMLNTDLYESMNVLATNDKFREIVALTDRALEERYDLDLITRFLVFRTMSEGDLKRVGDLNDFTTTQIQVIARDPAFDIEQTKEAFERTIDLLYSTMGNESFKKYHQSRQKFLGGFTISAFEGIALGIAYHYPNILDISTEELKAKSIEMWNHPEFVKHTGSGVSASQRIPHTIRIGRDIFKP